MSRSYDDHLDALRGALPYLYKRQQGICFYCGCEVRLGRMKVIRVNSSHRPCVTGPERMRLYKLVQATIEHLHRLADGGSDHASNLRMACLFCNSSRHEASVNAHRAAMRALVARKRHPLTTFELVPRLTQPKNYLIKT